MKSLLAKIASFALLATLFVLIHPTKTEARQNAAANEPGQPSQTMVVTRSNAIPSAQGAAGRFVGSVKMDTLAEPKDGTHTRVLSVTFSPGAYTAWHSHPLGQVLVVTAGNGFVQQWGGKLQEIHPGDVVWTPPNVKHWHGAGVKESLTHIAVYEEAPGKTTNWMEPLTEEQYNATKNMQ